MDAYKYLTRQAVPMRPLAALPGLWRCCVALAALGPALTVLAGITGGSFEDGLVGMTTAGEVRIVSRVGILQPTHGQYAALLSTAPDVGTTPADATQSSLAISGVTVPADYDQIRLDVNLLSNELTASFAEDLLTVVLVDDGSGAEIVLARLDVFDVLYPAPWTNHDLQSGFRTLVCDVAALAGNGKTYTLEIRLADQGDGRVDSAALVDNVRLSHSDTPVGRTNVEVVQANAGDSIFFNALSTSDNGTITEYRWDFGDGRTGTGPAGTIAYANDGVYQATMTAVDDEGNTSVDTFLVMVGPPNHAPSITSTAVTTAVAGGTYTYHVVADDAELLFGDTLTYSLVEGPVGMRLDAATGMLTWPSIPDTVADYPVTVAVTDSLGLADSQSYTLSTVIPRPFVAISNDKGNLYAATSNGDGSWSDFHALPPLSGKVRGLAVADFDGDGLDDIIAGYPKSDLLTFYLFHNDGTNHFINVGPVGTGTGASSYQMGMTAADINHDGIMDFISTGNWKYVHVGVGLGGGRFEVSTRDVTLGNGRAMDSADWNHDGHPDLLRAVYGSGKVYVHVGDGVEVAGAGILLGDVGSDPYGLTAADFNEDGYIDVVSTGSSSGVLGFRAGQADGSLAAAVTIAELNSWVACDNYDYNGDGHEDLVVLVSSAKTAYFYPGHGDGTFGDPTIINDVAISGASFGISAPPARPQFGDPVPRIAPAAYVGDPGDTVDLSASASTDDGSIVSYTWDFGDGSTGAGENVTHTFPGLEADYLVRLTVRDNDGRVGIASARIRLRGTPPVVVAGPPGGYVFGEAYASGGVYTVPLDASASQDDGAAPLRYEWDLGNGFTETFDGAILAPGLWRTDASTRLQGGELAVGAIESRTVGRLVTVAQFNRLSRQTFTARLRVEDGADSSHRVAWGICKSGNKVPTALSDYLYAFYFYNGGIRIQDTGKTITTSVAFPEGEAWDVRIDVQYWGAVFYVRLPGQPEWQRLYESLGYQVTPLRLGLSAFHGLCTLEEAGWSSERAEGEKPEAAYVGPGVYTVMCTAIDGVGQRSSTTTTVTLVPNETPIADPGDVYRPGEDAAECGVWTVDFDASGSVDDHGIHTYRWDFGDGSEGTGMTPSHTYAEAGRYDVVLTVIDNAVQTHTAATQVITVPGEPPNADAGGPYSVDEHDASEGRWTAHFDGGASTDDSGRLCDYAWDFGDGATGTGVSPTHVYDAPGQYTVTLTVRDHALQESVDVTTIDVLQGESPVPYAGGPYDFDEAFAHMGQWIVSLSAAGSTDDVGIWTYDWDFGDGTTGSGMDVTHAYAKNAADAEHTFTATLTVTDHGQRTASVTVPVVIRNNDPPTAEAGPDLVTEVGMPVWLDASDSSDDFGIWTYAWQPWHAHDPLALRESFVGGMIDPYLWAARRAYPGPDGGIELSGLGWNNRGHLLSNGFFARHAGDTYTGRIKVQANDNNYLAWGLKNDQANSNSMSPGQMLYGFEFYHADLWIREGTYRRQKIGVFLPDTWYELRIDVKEPKGAVYYMRESGVDAWTQVYDSLYADNSSFRLGAIVETGTCEVDDFTGAVPRDRGAIPLRRCQVAYPEAGTYTPLLTVTDHAVQRRTDTLTVTVLEGQPPVARIGGPYTTNEDIPTRFDAGESTDDFGIKTYHWDFGDGESLLSRNPWVDHRYTTEGTYTVTLEISDYAGHTDSDSTTVSVSPDPVVACVPWHIVKGVEVPHDTWSGNEVLLKAVAWSLHEPLTSTWDFGDGSSSAPEEITEKRRIEARHIYVGAVGTPYVATLTVTDALGRSATSRYLIRLRSHSLDVEINAGIDNGLWALHTLQTRGAFAPGEYGNATIDYGSWPNEKSPHPALGSTSSVLQAFMVNGHSEEDDVRQDPYVETVARGLRFLPTEIRPLYLKEQKFGDPDSNRNSIGLEATTGQQGYQVGMTMDGLVVVGNPFFCPITGPTNVRHRSYYDILLDMVDACAYGQGDGTSYKGGGWRYNWNGGTDNSASQWTAMGLLAVQEILHFNIPFWVKDRFDLWLQYSHAAGGGFGYTGPGTTANLTSAGMASLPLCDRVGYDDPATPEDERDPRWREAEAYIAEHWNSSFWWPYPPESKYSVYAYWGFAKAMRTARPQAVERLASTGFDWFKDPENGMARRVLDRQKDDGSWDRDGLSYGVGQILTTAWNVLILTPTLFVQPPVADAGEDTAWALDVPLLLDGSASYHLDPFRKIVLYEWDIDGDGVYDTSSPDDPTTMVTFSSSDYPTLPQTIVCRLRVTDNNDPPKTDTADVAITIAVVPHPPLARAGGPYEIFLGESLTLDGSASMDPDAGDRIVSWDWDLDGDLDFDDATGVTASITPTELGSFTVSLRVRDNGVLNDLNANGVVDDDERLTSYDTTTVTVLEPPNHAPTLATVDPLTPITEDDVDPPGNGVGSTFGEAISDTDGDPDGIAVTGVGGDGIWQYALAGDEWADFGNVTPAAALLLPGSASVRFLPRLAFNNGQTASMTLRAWDHTSGNPRDRVDVTTNGDTTAFSTAEETAQLLVQPVNDPPQAWPDEGRTDADSSVTVDVLANDTDVDNDDDVSTFSVDDAVILDRNDDPPGSGGGSTAAGTISVVNNAVHFDPGDDFDALPAGNHSTVHIEYTMSDDEGAAARAILTITVLGTNGPPSIGPDHVATDEDTPLVFPAGNLAANDSDPDGDLLSVTGVAARPDSHGTISLEAGQITYTPEANYNGPASFSYTVEDPHGSSASGTVAITVNPVNDAPVLDDTDVPVPSPVTEDDTDPPGDLIGDLVDLHITDIDDGALQGVAIIAVTGDGTWQFQSDGGTWVAFEEVSNRTALLLEDSTRLRFLPRLEVNNGQTASITLHAWDRTLGNEGELVDATVCGGTSAFSEAAETLMLAVTDVNDPPVIDQGEQLGVTMDEDGDPMAWAAPTITAVDPDIGAELTWSLATPPAHGSAVSSGNGNAPEGLSYAPEANWNGLDSLVVEVDDGEGGSDSIVLEITVSPRNDKPTVETQPAVDGPIFVGSEAHVDDGLWSDAVDLAPGTLTLTRQWQRADDGTGTNAADIVGAVAPTLTVTPDLAHAWLRAVVTCTDDGEGQPATEQTQAASPWVAVGNAPPEPSPDSGETDEDTSWTIAANDLSANDEDPDGDPLNISSVSGTAATHGTVSLTGGQVIYTPSPDYTGPASFFYRVADDHGSTATGDVTLFVNPVNDAPVLADGSTVVLSPITEDDTEPPGDLVDDLVGDLISDVDAGAIRGIAITASSGDGVWQSQPDGGGWTNVGSVTAAEALLLGSSTRLRFLPRLAYNNGQTASITIRAWDQTSGAEGDTATILDTGGTTAFSTHAVTLMLTVAAVNDAPVLDPEGPLTVPDVAAGTRDPPGTSVSTILTSTTPADAIEDVDFGAIKGIAVLAADDVPGGVWQVRLDGSAPWSDLPAVSSSAALLLGLNAELRFVPPSYLAADRRLEVTFRAWDKTSGSEGGLGDTTLNGGTSAYSSAVTSFSLLLLGGGEATENWWYPSFSWDPLSRGGKGTDYVWYHVQVFAVDDLLHPAFEANVQGTSMTVVEYFLAAFDGFPEGTYVWRYRPWDPATDSYGAYVPEDLGATPSPAYVLDLAYGPAATPANLSITETAPGLYLLSFLVGNARGYEVKICGTTSGYERIWRHAFIPGEDPDKQQATPETLGQDNPVMETPLIPRDEPATMAVNLTVADSYRVFVRGFNPTDELNGMPPFTEFPATIVLTADQTACSPAKPTGLVPHSNDLIAMPESLSVMPHRLQWDPVPGADSYVLYLAAANATPLFNFDDVGSDTYLPVNLAPGSYTWQVIGMSRSGALPDYGTWSEAQHVQVVRELTVPAMARCVERLTDTRIRVHWAADGAVPDEVEVRHIIRGQLAWTTYAPRTLLNVDPQERTGEIEIDAFGSGGRHYVFLRGYSASQTGGLIAGEPRIFPIPATPGATGPRKPKLRP